jgi:glutamate--cysteine ligase
VPRLAFRTPFRGRTVRDFARDMLNISAEGLRRRAAQDSAGMNEDGFLVPLRELVDRGYTRAEELLGRYQSEWKGNLAPLFTEYNFL